MIKSTELIDEINKSLQKYYPIKTTFKNIQDLLGKCATGKINKF
jgi:hypothetical protein